jgi:hypothetical protein
VNIEGAINPIIQSETRPISHVTTPARENFLLDFYHPDNTGSRDDRLSIMKFLIINIFPFFLSLPPTYVQTFFGKLVLFSNLYEWERVRLFTYSNFTTDFIHTYFN